MIIGSLYPSDFGKLQMKTLSSKSFHSIRHHLVFLHAHTIEKFVKDESILYTTTYIHFYIHLNSSPKYTVAIHGEEFIVNDHEGAILEYLIEKDYAKIELMNYVKGCLDEIQSNQTQEKRGEDSRKK